MFGFIKIISICLLFFALDLPIYSEETKEPQKIKSSVKDKETSFEKKAQKNKSPFLLSWINQAAYADPIENDDKNAIRKEWENILGVDIFEPYFAAKKAEKWVKERASVSVLSAKGSPEFDKHGVKYIFKIGF